MTLFCGPVEEDNISAHQMVLLISESVEVMGDTARLAGKCVLPYIETDVGYRYYGLKSILKFVSRYLNNQLLSWER
ncbi:MAG: hypothetical protein AAB847_02980 [Patescibacteria group bacterium]